MPCDDFSGVARLLHAALQSGDDKAAHHLLNLLASHHDSAVVATTLSAFADCPREALHEGFPRPEVEEAVREVVKEPAVAEAIRKRNDGVIHLLYVENMYGPIDMGQKNDNSTGNVNVQNHSEGSQQGVSILGDASVSGSSLHHSSGPPAEFSAKAFHDDVVECIRLVAERIEDIEETVATDVMTALRALKKTDLEHANTIGEAVSALETKLSESQKSKGRALLDLLAPDGILAAAGPTLVQLVSALLVTP